MKVAFSLRGAGGLVALAALASASAAPAAHQTCLTRAELGATVAYALPTAIEATARMCRPVLARDGYLASAGADLAARYRAGQATAWPVARSAVIKLQGGGLGKMAALLSDSTLQDLAAAAIAQFVAQTVHPGDCAEMEQALQLMAPLPPENTTGLIALAVQRSERSREGGNSADPATRLPICPLAPASSGTPAGAFRGSGPASEH
jgi:hypothetical protein